jgi:hypothetical protein
VLHSTAVVSGDHLYWSLERPLRPWWVDGWAHRLAEASGPALWVPFGPFRNFPSDNPLTSAFTLAKGARSVAAKTMTLMRSRPGASAAAVQANLADQLRKGAVELLASHAAPSGRDEERPR